ncbi:ABC transporter permease [Parapedobacter koreensis]|uniref:ABC-type antimicrobial peptide transport system, permease component n=1 Tax=Parapedobacter koreensis TaxID=332977 RepID=A0A1H7NSG9_9SPHI|nr:ABC transporter permease [Parapedobacter koreensis]SEL26493.1 ABC-type antimicrobial peptide transport system, permease component [Parapedobacter koreensis]
MIKNHLKTAWRTILRQRTNSVIHLSGLAVGMTAAFFIFLWVKNEYSFDRYHPDADRIYRLTSHAKRAGTTSASTPYTWGEGILGQLSDVQAFTRMRPITGVLPSIGNADQLLKEKAAAYVDAHWFAVFHYDFLAGRPQPFRNHPHSLILTASAAIKYMGKIEGAVGKTLLVDGTAYTVQGIITDPPTNSSFHYSVYLPVAARHTDPLWRTRDFQDDFNTYSTYIKLAPGASPDGVVQRVVATAPEHWRESDTLSLRALSDLHFENDLDFTDLRHGNRPMTGVLLLLGVLLLVVACINYVNLTTAKATVRVKEISIKKIVGAERRHLFAQFVMETVLLATIALLIALLLTWAFLPFFNQLTSLSFVLSLADPSLWTLYGGTLLATLVMASIYPALLLSAFRPIAALRGHSFGPVKDSLLRKALVVVQFSISVALIAGTLVIYQQMRFIDRQYDQYDKSQVFSFLFRPSRDLSMEAKRAYFENVRQELLSHSSIADAAVNSGVDVVDMRNEWSGFDWDGRDENKVYPLTFFPIGSTLDGFYQLEVTAGRWFLPDSREDEHNYVLNETAVHQLGIREPVIGQRLSLGSDTVVGRIIGVVADFHYLSVREKIGAVIFGNNPWYANSFSVKSVPGRQAEALTAAAQVFNTHLPDEPFDYQFVSEEFEQVYREDYQAATLIAGFSVLALLVSCLGLYGLAAFSAERRHKEIGIRKVLGATVSGIAGLLSKDFVKSVLVAIAIASPIAYWAMEQWLADFAYRITLSWWVFAVAGLAAIIVALLTVSGQAIRAALANPVDSLRDE